jgi:membrane fusion protein (multidrug efflux system)
MSEMPRIDHLRPAATVNASLADTPRPHAAMFKRAALAAALLAGTAAICQFGYGYWTTGRFLVSTDDAYVKADYTIIAPKVSGYIGEVLVDDNATVKAGQVLARIDDRDFRAALDQTRADVAAADAAVLNLDSQTALQQAEIAQAAAQVSATRAAGAFANQDAARYRELARTGDGSVQRAQQTGALRAQSGAELQRDQAGLIAAARKVAVLQTARRQAEAQADRARAVMHQAELNEGYTTITAPVDGSVGARTLRVGQFVAAGTDLMAVVPLHAVYVVANFKETQLAGVYPGQSVRLVVDGLPGLHIAAHVDSVSPASGLEFALLPPDNATGNFTKIVQRIPVKIVLDHAPEASLLRAGMSVEPTIDTKPASSRAG